MLTVYQIIAEFDKKALKSSQKDLEGAILAMIQRRPVTLSDISASLGRHKSEVIKYLDFLLKEGKIRPVTHKGLKYFESI